MFWETLGFDVDQLASVKVAGEEDMLTPILGAAGDCIALRAYNSAFLFRRAAKFAYVPETERDIAIECHREMREVSADPASMEAEFSAMLDHANYNSRFYPLNVPRNGNVIFPQKIKRLRGYLITEPINLFPIDSSASFDGQNFEVYINTKTGRGTIVELRLPEDNVFGLTSRHLGYDRSNRKFREYTVRNSRPLGVRDQHCQVTSGDLHMSRTLIKPNPTRTNQCLVAVFSSDKRSSADQPFLPLNRLSSASTYSSIRFRVFSAHRNQTFTVSKEVYSYLFCFEIRGFS